MVPELVLSSYLFVAIGIVGFSHKRYVLGTVSCVCGILSILYWMSPSTDILRNLDKASAVVSLLVYTVYGSSRVWGFSMVFAGWVLWCATGLLYLISVRLHASGDARWKRVHAFFHGAAAAGQAFVIR